MGKPTFDNGILRLTSQETHVLRDAGFGFPLSNEGMRLLNKIGGFKLTRGTETSQYPEERTSTETPLVVASESGPGQWRTRDNRNRLESRALAGDSPVRVMRAFVLE